LASTNTSGKEPGLAIERAARFMLDRPGNPEQGWKFGNRAFMLAE